MKKNVIILVLCLLCRFVYADCEIIPFIKGYHDNITKNDVFFIKGKIIESEFHGLKILVLDNFKDNPINDSITVWCTTGNDYRQCNNQWYNVNDTLILIITYTNLIDQFTWYDESERWVEEEGDYMPLDCVVSILQLNTNYITGRIFDYGADTTIHYNAFFELLTKNVNSTENYLNSTFITYPNPTNGFLTVEFDNELNPYFFEVVSSSGRVIKRIPHDKHNHYLNINLSQLPSGPYIIRVQKRNGKSINTKIFKL